jgi:hypothetical protein
LDRIEVTGSSRGSHAATHEHTRRAAAVDAALSLLRERPASDPVEST